jgi:hypothetical protein
MKLNLHYLWAAAGAKQRLATCALARRTDRLISGWRGMRESGSGFEEINKTVDLSTAICCALLFIDLSRPLK